MVTKQEYKTMKHETTFTITIDGQEILVHYQPLYFVTAGYARFEFTSPHNPPCQIPVSETGYLSYFLPQHEVDITISIKEYASMVAMALMANSHKTQGEQMSLF
jgi:hypothetical protein